MIDHTLLRPEAGQADVEALVAEARELGILAICVSPSRLPVTADGLVVATVCDFPSGTHAYPIKIAEAHAAASCGADEVDVVIDPGAALAGEWASVEAELTAVRAVVPGVLKVIIESALLDDDGIVTACRVAEAAGAESPRPRRPPASPPPAA